MLFGGCQIVPLTCGYSGDQFDEWCLLTASIAENLG